MVSCFDILTEFTHIGIAGIGIYFLILAISHDFQGTAWHAFLMIFGFHVLIAESFMSRYPVKYLRRIFSYRTISVLHGILQIVGSLIAIKGAYYKYSSTEVHFGTWHGKFGLLVVALCVLNCLGCIIKRLRFAKIAFVLAMLTILLGYQTEFFLKLGHNTRLLSMITICVFVCSLIAKFDSEKPDFNITCYNCKKRGHRWRSCNVPTRCFGCGTPSVIYSRCLKCQQVQRQ